MVRIFNNTKNNKRGRGDNKSRLVGMIFWVKISSFLCDKGPFCEYKVLITPPPINKMLFLHAHSNSRVRTHDLQGWGLIGKCLYSQNSDTCIQTMKQLSYIIYRPACHFVMGGPVGGNEMTRWGNERGTCVSGDGMWVDPGSGLGWMWKCGMRLPW